MSTEFVINGISVSGTYGVWARGETLKEAKQGFKRRGGGLSRGYQLAEFGEDSTFKGIDGFGSIHWEGKEPKITEVKPRGGKR